MTHLTARLTLMTTDIMNMDIDNSMNLNTITKVLDASTKFLNGSMKVVHPTHIILFRQVPMLFSRMKMVMKSQGIIFVQLANHLHIENERSNSELATSAEDSQGDLGEKLRLLSKMNMAGNYIGRLPVSAPIMR
jgi:hypothetical protein